MPEKNSLADFAKRMNARADRLDFSVNAKIKIAAKSALRWLTVETPFDTAEALSNWEVAFDGPVMRFFSLPPYIPGNRAGSAAEAYRIGEAVIDAKKPGQSIWISNSVPYIEQLANGSSTQKPAGWIEGVKVIIRHELAAGTGNVRRTN